MTYQLFKRLLGMRPKPRQEVLPPSKTLYTPYGRIIDRPGDIYSEGSVGRCEINDYDGHWPVGYGHQGPTRGEAMVDRVVLEITRKCGSAALAHHLETHHDL